MRFDWSTLVLQTVNFAILVWLLNRFLYKPMLRTIDARRAEIEKRLAEAARTQSEASTRLASIEADRAGIAVERTAVLTAAAAQAEAANSVRRAEAERDATALVSEARKTLAIEHSQALAEVQRAALDLGTQIAGRLLADVPDSLRTEAWLERIVQHIERLPKEELQGLTQPLTGDASLRVVTASSLPPETAQTWRARLHQVLGCAISVAFDVQESLIAGAELHFPQAVIRLSWSSVLDSIRSETDPRGDAR